MDNDSKIGLLVTRDGEGYPHITFISSLQALGETELTFGAFCAGLSKTFIEERPRAGFLALNAGMQFVRGTAAYTHKANTGAEYDLYNNKPLFRYNSYFGYHTVYYLALESIAPLETLNRNKIVCGALLTRLCAPFHARRKKKILRPVGRRLFNQLDGLKFLAWFDESGAPHTVPVIQAGCAGSDRVAISRVPFGHELRAVPDGVRAAVLALNLNMESVLVKGHFSAGKGLVSMLDIERVYNSMPPKMEYIYPRSDKPEPIAAF